MTPENDEDEGMREETPRTPAEALAALRIVEDLFEGSLLEHRTGNRAPGLLCETEL
jgi:hypothetical protein